MTMIHFAYLEIYTNAFLSIQTKVNLKSGQTTINKNKNDWFPVKNVWLYNEYNIYKGYKIFADFPNENGVTL